jgi:hypothetical protein
MLSEGQMSDFKGAALMLPAMPKARELLADKGCRRRRGGGAGGVRRRLRDGGMATGQRDGGGEGRVCGGRAVLEESGRGARGERRGDRDVPSSGSVAEARQVADGV